MRDAFIHAAVRTPIGRFRGALSSLSAIELAAPAIRAALHRAQVRPGGVDEVILGQVLTAGVGQAPARQAALAAGLPPDVGALTINKVCGSGLKAAMLAAQAVQCGDAEIVVAGGMECMSRAGYVLPREAAPLGDRTLIDSLQRDGLTCAGTGRLMGDIADDLARRRGIRREELDRYAVESHRRACAACDGGFFTAELVPVAVNPVAVKQRGGPQLVEQDEGPRRDTSLERLAALAPAFHPDGVVTAGNASMISDGAAVVVIGSDAAARRHAVQPLARIVASVTVGGPPEDLFEAPVEAIQRVVQKGHRALREIDLFEINEAFAVQVLACLRRLDLPPERVNVHGGAIALGHPIGASGARVLVTLVHALHARDVECGVAALCLGGGNAVAMLIERC